ncbi:MAG: helix-turn-helix transcriptional regulator [Treponema sp.]|jgi:DNA-binding transcriptional regulator YiaG|nr:helix-turn-helix transcriptional regulator [Treponema sp.]
MAKKFSELEAKMSPEARLRVEQKVKKALAEMPLNELRNARGLSQKMLAEALNIQQPTIAKLERRTDTHILPALKMLRIFLFGLSKRRIQPECYAKCRLRFSPNTPQKLLEKIKRI